MDNARLCELFGGRDRFRLLRALYLTPNRRRTNGQLAADAKVPTSNVSKWLKLWTALGLVLRFVDGRNISYQASDDPLLAGLTSIMLHDDALVNDIRNALPAAVKTAAIFGSTARGEEHAASDIDVLVLGEKLSSIRINAALKPVARKHRREIHASVFSPSEFAGLLRQEDSFATGLVSRPTVVVKGEFKYGQTNAG